MMDKAGQIPDIGLRFITVDDRDELIAAVAVNSVMQQRDTGKELPQLH